MNYIHSKRIIAVALIATEQSVEKQPFGAKIVTSVVISAKTEITVSLN